MTSSPNGSSKSCPRAKTRGRRSPSFRILSYPQERIAAAGDQLNDLPMLEAAGGKFAVSNGVDALKRAATVIPSNEEDGVALCARTVCDEGAVARRRTAMNEHFFPTVTVMLDSLRAISRSKCCMRGAASSSSAASASTVPVCALRAFSAISIRSASSVIGLTEHEYLRSFSSKSARKRSKSSSTAARSPASSSRAICPFCPNSWNSRGRRQRPSSAQAASRRWSWQTSSPIFRGCSRPRPPFTAF